MQQLQEGQHLCHCVVGGIVKLEAVSQGANGPKGLLSLCLFLRESDLEH